MNKYLLPLLIALFPSSVFAAAALVQSAGENDSGTTAVINGTGGAADDWVSPTSGNLLVACWAARPNAATISWTPPAGWTLIQENSAGSAQASGWMGYKVSDGTESSLTFTVANQFNQAVVVQEWSGLENTLDSSGEDTSGVSTNPTTALAPSLTTVAADTLVVSCLEMFVESNWDPATVATGYTDDLREVFTGGAGVEAAYKVLSASGSETANWSTTDTGHKVYATIAAFEITTGPTTTWTDTTIDVGQDAAGTLDIAFSGNTTQCEFASGDTISVTANASTTAGDCATAKADFLSGGSLSNTRIASATTAFLRNTTETSTGGSITINSPDDGVTDHFGTAACANPGCDDDSLYENSDFLTEYPAFASGDDVWVTVSTGACDFDATTGVFSCTTLPATGTVRVYDVTATDWLTESTWSIAAPAGAGAFRLSLDSPLRGVLRSPLRAPIQ